MYPQQQQPSVPRPYGQSGPAPLSGPPQKLKNGWAFGTGLSTLIISGLFGLLMFLMFVVIGSIGMPGDIMVILGLVFTVMVGLGVTTALLTMKEKYAGYIMGLVLSGLGVLGAFINMVSDAERAGTAAASVGFYGLYVWLFIMCLRRHYQLKPLREQAAQAAHNARASRKARGPRRSLNQPGPMQQPQYQQPMQQGYAQPQYQQPTQQGYAQPQYQQPMHQGYAQPQYQQPMQQGYAQPQYQQPMQAQYQQPMQQAQPQPQYPQPVPQSAPQQMPVPQSAPRQAPVKPAMSSKQAAMRIFLLATGLEADRLEARKQRALAGVNKAFGERSGASFTGMLQQLQADPTGVTQIGEYIKPIVNAGNDRLPPSVVRVVTYILKDSSTITPAGVDFIKRLEDAMAEGPQEDTVVIDPAFQQELQQPPQ